MKILSVELQTNNLKGTLLFYHEILGLEVLLQSETQLSFKVGGSELIFTEADLWFPHYHFAFEVPNNRLDDVADHLDNCVQWVKQPDGGLFADFKAWNVRSIYCYDIHDNILEFIARFDNDTASEREFDDTQYVCISEIGLVGADVGQLAAEIGQKTGVGAYLKQPAGMDFAALGDDEGLLILSGENRCWFPTNYEAKRHPTRVIIEHNNELHELQYL